MLTCEGRVEPVAVTVAEAGITVTIAAAAADAVLALAIRALGEKEALVEAAVYFDDCIAVREEAQAQAEVDHDGRVPLLLRGLPLDNHNPVDVGILVGRRTE